MPTGLTSGMAFGVEKKGEIKIIQHKFKDYKHNPIEKPDNYKCNLEPRITEHLDEIWEEYGCLSAKRLEVLSHHEDPWKNTRKDCAPRDYCSETISKDDMREYYARKVNG